MMRDYVPASIWEHVRFDMEREYVSRKLAKALKETLVRLSSQVSSLIQELDTVSDELNRMVAQRKDVETPCMPADASVFNLRCCLENAFDTIEHQLMGELVQGHQDDLQVARRLLNGWGYIDDIRLPLERVFNENDTMCPKTACVLRAQKPDDDRMTVISPWSNRVEYLAVLPLDVDDIQGW